MYIERYINLPLGKSFFLLGPRQTGKSTVIAKKFSNVKFLKIDLLRGETFRRFRAHPEVLRNEVETAQLTQKITHVIIDEIQKIPDLLDEVHGILESENPCHFILSGSSARKLKRCHANMLGGRALNIHFHPFIYHEIADTFCLEKVLQFGSLPPVYTCTSENEKIEILKSYVDLYLKEEIEMEANLRNLDAFLRFLQVAAAQNGEIVNYSNIARDAGVTSATIKGYYKILEDTLLGFLLLPYSRSIRKKLVQHPKFYFFDTGVVRTLTNKITVPIEAQTSDYGNAFEQWLICEMIRLNEYNGMDLTFSFYRTDQGVEVDVIIETPRSEVIALEIKSTSTPVKKNTNGVASFRKVESNTLACIICCCENALQIDGVLCLPWQDWLQHFEKNTFIELLSLTK
jgi:uncharacterized protein